MNAWPEPGQVVHYGPCLPALVFGHQQVPDLTVPDLTGMVQEVYIRVLVPKHMAAAGLAWGGVMVVSTDDMEGWVPFGGEHGWHWPEHGHG
jgi:hypothetical protein